MLKKEALKFTESTMYPMLKCPYPGCTNYYLPRVELRFCEKHTRLLAQVKNRKTAENSPALPPAPTPPHPPQPKTPPVPESHQAHGGIVTSGKRVKRGHRKYIEEKMKKIARKSTPKDEKADEADE